MINNFYEKPKERLRKKARERCQNLSKEGKDKSKKKAGEKYQNFTDE